MKKLNKGIAIGVIAFMIIGVVVVYNFKIKRTYSEIVNQNWKITMPKEDKELYSYNTESFLGDGERYHILEYKDINEVLNSLKWENSRNIDVEIKVSSMINKLEIPKEHMPNLEQGYLYYNDEKEDKSELNIILTTSNNRVYIAEDMY